MDVSVLVIPQIGEVPIALPKSIAARMDLVGIYSGDSTNRLRLLWAVLGLCWAHPKRRLPTYRPDRGDRDLYAYAAKVMEVAVGQWGISPYQVIQVLDMDREPITLQRISDDSPEPQEIPVTLSSVGMLLYQYVEESIPRPEVIDMGANFTSQKEAV